MVSGEKKRRGFSRPLHTGLVLLLLLQIYVVGSFLLNGYCRIYAPACQWLLGYSMPDALKVRISEFRIYPGAQLEIINLQLLSQHAAFQAVDIKSVQIVIPSLLNSKIELNLDQISILRPKFADALAASEGKITPMTINSLRLDLNKNGSCMSIPSMTAILGPWALNGSIEIPNYQRIGTENETLNWPQLHLKIDEWMRKYQSIANKVEYERPFIHFCIKQTPNGAWDVLANLDVEKVSFSSSQLSRINGKFRYKSSAKISGPQCHLSFTVDAADYKQDSLHINGKSITATSQSITAPHGSHLENLKLSLHSPQVTINQLAKFNVPEIELQLTKSGLVNVVGVGFLEKLSEQMPARLARFEGCSLGKGTKLDVCLNYSPQAAKIKSLSGTLNAQDFKLQNLLIDRIDTAFSWQQISQELQLHQASLQRGQEWVELEGMVHLPRKNYRLAVEASTIPTDYNPIMPDWWKKLFRDLEFLEQPICNANFEVVGRFDQRVADFFYGSVQAQNLAYRGVPIDSGQLQLRGRQHYSEINQLAIRQGAHRARGSIHIAGLPDPIKAPLFWSIDVHSTFPLEAYQKLVSPKVAAQIQLFEANQAPEVHFKGKFFTKHYPQYRPYMHFKMHADSLGPIYYQNVPLEALQFKLAGNAEQLSIHDLKASIANGRAAGQIDFDWQSSLAPSMRIKGAIQGCDTKKLLKMFHEAERAALSNLAPIEESPSKIDLEVHLKGPTGNWFEFNGYGRAAIHDDALGSIKLLGPLSSLLQKTPLNFTSLKFKTLDSGFELAQSSLYFDQLTIGGHSSQIKMKGRYNFELDSLDMFATLHPLINYADKLNPVTPLNRLIQLPLSPLFKFKLNGSLQNPRWRSILDPRFLLPIF